MYSPNKCGSEVGNTHRHLLDHMKAYRDSDEERKPSHMMVRLMHLIRLTVTRRKFKTLRLIKGK